MGDQLKATGLDFGTIIAFVAPGFITLLALAYHVPTAQAWITAAGQQEPNVGGFLFALLASLALGIAVSGARSLLLDDRTTVIDWSALDADKLGRLVTLRDNYFRYYQFYANTFLAVILWGTGRLLAQGPRLTFVGFVVWVAVLAILFASARRQLAEYRSGVGTLVRAPTG